MKLVYRKSDGAYCDSEESFVGGADADGMIRGPNVMGRFGGQPSDYVVVEVDPAELPEPPCRMKLSGGELVPDQAKIDAAADRAAAAAEDAQRLAYLREQCKKGLATQAEIMELVGKSM